MLDHADFEDTDNVQVANPNQFVKSLWFKPGQSALAVSDEIRSCCMGYT